MSTTSTGSAPRIAAQRDAVAIERKISVVTISFNQAGYLPRALGSVAAQRNIAHEHIVVDPGSQDGSRAIIDKAASHPEIVRIYERDKGPSDGLNKGFSAAHGDIFYFLNADDMVCPGAFEFARKFFDEHPDIDVIYGGGYLIDEHDKKVEFVRPTQFTCIAYLLDATNLLQQSFFFRRSAYERVGGFNAENRVSWDGELFFRMKAAGLRFHSVYAPIGLFRIYAGSITTSDGHAQRRRSIRMALATEYFRRPVPTWFDRLKPLWTLKKQASATMIYLRTLLRHRRLLTSIGMPMPPLHSVTKLWSPSTR